MATPKTGLAQKMRECMKKHRKPFTPAQICDELDLSGRARDKARNSFRDFMARNEIILNEAGKYTYNKHWKKDDKKKPVLKKRILKSMYVMNREFTISDIQHLSDAPDISHVMKTIRKLASEGYLRQVGQIRTCLTGIKPLYAIVDRNRFRIEVMG